MKGRKRSSEILVVCGILVVVVVLLRYISLMIWTMECLYSGGAVPTRIPCSIIYKFLLVVFRRAIHHRRREKGRPMHRDVVYLFFLSL